MTTNMPHGSDTQAQAFAESAASTWDELVVRLAPIIGERGFRVLYTRSVQLTQSAFPWLVAATGAAGYDAAESNNTHALSASLSECLRHQSADVAADAHRALLRTFTQLLDALIGPALMARLLESQLPSDDADKSAQETPRDR